MDTHVVLLLKLPWEWYTKTTRIAVRFGERGWGVKFWRGTQKTSVEMKLFCCF